jgi:hypothetical protein
MIDGSQDPAAEAYRDAVSEIIELRRSTRPYPADAPDLTIVKRRQPGSVAELAPAELAQLAAAWQVDGEDDLDDVLADDEFSLEAAEVVDAGGRLRFRLYGWNFGVGYLFPPEGLEVVAFGAQHDLEHWRLDQRPIFAAMDRALRRPGHGFTQPLNFCWDDDTCWEDLRPRSEPYLRAQFRLSR